MIPKMNRDSSSDESDDVIPPTPMFKSTPLYSSARARKRSSSSESSSDHHQDPLRNPPLNTEADDSSSGDETTRPTAVKREGISRADSSSSSSGDERQQQGTPQAATASTQVRPVRRPVHSMSSSDSEDDEHVRSPPKGQLRGESESSDDENENSLINARRGSTFSAITKVENARSENESDADSSEDTPGPSTKCIISSSVHAGNDIGDSEDEETEPQNTHASNVSSNDEREEESRMQLNIKPSAQSSSDESCDEAATMKLPNYPVRSDEDSSEESSEESSDEGKNAVSTKLPATSTKLSAISTKPPITLTIVRPSEYLRDEGETSEVAVKKHVSTSNVNSMYTKTSRDSSEESSEEDEGPVLTQTPASIGRQASSDSSEEDEGPVLTPAPASIRRQASSDSSEEDEGPVLTPAPASIRRQASSDSSEEDEGPVVTPTPASVHHQASSDSSDDDKARQQTTRIVIPPRIIKKDTKSDEDSSDSEEDGNSAPRTLPGTSLGPQATSDMRDGKETSFKARTGNNQDDSGNETSDVDSSDKKHSPQKSLGSQTVARTVSSEPLSMMKDRKMGISLLDETFQGSDQLQVDDAPLCREDIGSDDEIWLVQCPKFMNISALRKQPINLSAEKDIQLADGATFKRFSVAPKRGLKTSINCLLPSKTDGTFLMSCLPVKGKVVINEHVHVPKLKIPATSATGPVPFPSNLKVRHPLLGAGFEKHIAEAKIALQEASYSSKKKKKDKKRDRSGFDSFQNLSDDSFHNNVITSSSKSNGTHEKIHSEGKRYANSNYEEVSAKKRKKMSLSEKETPNEKPFADHTQLNGSDKKKHKKSKKEVTNEKCSEFERRANDVGNKPSWHTPQTDDTPVSAVNFESEPVSKKVKKSKAESSKLLSLSSIKQERDNSLYLNGFDKEQSRDSSVSKKRKRKDIDDSGNQNFDEAGSLLKSSKKRKT